MTAEENMIISVKNYGPIAKAENIELRPLTVFVGPSNTGKSYLAILIHALFRSILTSSFDRRSLMGPWETEIIAFDFSKSKQKHVAELMKHALKKGIAKATGIKFFELSDELQELSTEGMGKIIARRIHREISRCMGTTSSKKLLTENEFNLEFKNNRYDLSLTSSNEHSRIEIKKTKPTKVYRDFMLLHDIELAPDMILPELFLRNLLGAIIDSPRGRECLYLPAARTGIMQSYLAITSALIQGTSFTRLKGFSDPTLSGIISDFLKEIALMDTDKIPDPYVGKVASKMEKILLQGTIRKKFSKLNQPPQYVYTQNGTEIPLMHSSSMVSELAPIVLFIRHRVGRGDLLIIEEPESHLHPEAQRKMAEVVVDLIRRGVRIIITTHSEYFLEQLGNHVRLSSLSTDKRNIITGRSRLFLKEDEVGAYVFNRKKGGTIVNALHFDKENGLSPDDHDRVSSDLYNETVEILNEMDKDR